MTFQKESLKEAIFNRRMLICIFTGFASGLPLYILISLVPAWLRDSQVSLKEIGLFALIGFPYTWKFVWAPLMDHFKLPIMGRRRGWMLMSQIGVLICVAALGQGDPNEQIGLVAAVCALIAFFSASQDIVIDAYRREILPDAELGLGNSIHANAYRLSGLIPGSLSLILADHMAWQPVFMITAAFMLVGIAMTLTIDEPRTEVDTGPVTLGQAVVEPFREFIQRTGWQQALLMIAFMFLYKLGDNMATALATPFYLDMGFTKTEIGIVAKNAGLWPMVVGGILGGLMIVRTGINRALWIFGVVQLVSILGYVWLAQAGNDIIVLAVVVGFEYLGVGLGAAAFMAFMARATNIQHTATQLALFTALASLPRTFANASTGFIVESIGWTQFYLVCAVLAVPGMLLLFKVAPWNGEQEAAASLPEADKSQA